MWRRPLNSVFNHYHSQKIRKAAQEDRDLSAGLDDKWTVGMNRKDYIMQEFMGSPGPTCLRRKIEAVAAPF